MRKKTVQKIIFWLKKNIIEMEMFGAISPGGIYLLTC